MHSYQNMFSFMSHTVYGSCFYTRCTRKHPRWFQIRNIMQWYIMFIFWHDTHTGHTFWTSFFVRSFILRTSCLTPQGPCWNSFLRWRFGWLRFDKCTTRCKLDLSCQSGQLHDDTCIKLSDDLLAQFFLLVSVCPLVMVWRILEASQTVVGLSNRAHSRILCASHRIPSHPSIYNLRPRFGMWNPLFTARMTGWWRPYGSGDLRQMSSLATETEINIFMIPHFKVLPWNHETYQIEPCISWCLIWCSSPNLQIFGPRCAGDKEIPGRLCHASWAWKSSKSWRSWWSCLNLERAEGVDCERTKNRRFGVGLLDLEYCHTCNELPLGVPVTALWIFLCDSPEDQVSKCWPLPTRRVSWSGPDARVEGGQVCSWELKLGFLILDFFTHSGRLFAPPLTFLLVIVANNSFSWWLAWRA